MLREGIAQRAFKPPWKLILYFIEKLFFLICRTRQVYSCDTEVLACEYSYKIFREKKSGKKKKKQPTCML